MVEVGTPGSARSHFRPIRATSPVPPPLKSSASFAPIIRSPDCVPPSLPGLYSGRRDKLHEEEGKRMKLYRTAGGYIVEHQDQFFAGVDPSWDQLLIREDLEAHLTKSIQQQKPLAAASFAEIEDLLL